jgi:hypothetical protein
MFNKTVRDERRALFRNKSGRQYAKKLRALRASASKIFIRTQRRDAHEDEVKTGVLPRRRRQMDLRRYLTATLYAFPFRLTT